MIEMGPLEITEKTRAIVSFGPATEVSGFRPGEFFQVTIDPNMVSPSGEFIRFDSRFQEGEMHGWQRVEALTVWEVLGAAPDYEKAPEGYQAEEGAKVTMRAVL